MVVSESLQMEIRVRKVKRVTPAHHPRVRNRSAEIRVIPAVRKVM